MMQIMIAGPHSISRARVGNKYVVKGLKKVVFTRCRQELPLQSDSKVAGLKEKRGKARHRPRADRPHSTCNTGVGRFDTPGLAVRAEDSCLLLHSHIRGVRGFKDEVVGGHVSDGPEGALGAHLLFATIPQDKEHEKEG